MRIRINIYYGCFFAFFTLLMSNQVWGQQDQVKNNNIYLIIVSDNFLNSPSLLSFKAFRGQDYSVVKVAGSTVGNTKDDFRNYIRDLMPRYVLLVGQYGDFPVHVIPYPSPVESYNYYVAASLSGHPAQDIPLGLFFAENETELSNIINKTISYENNVSSYPKIYYAHAGSNEPLPPWPVQFNEEILTEMNDRFFGQHGFDFTLVSANNPPPNDVWHNIEMINNGIHFMIYHGHGLMFKWVFGLGVGGLSQLNNTIYPIILSFSCSTGTFSGELNGNTSDCFAQKIVANEHGAAAFVGAYNISGRGMNLLLKGMVSGFFNQSAENTLGDIMVQGFSNTTNSQTVEQYYPTVTMAERIRTAWQFHLFGDPALTIPTNGILTQVPKGISHQAVIRNINNELVANAEIGLQISIIQGAHDGDAVYTETHQVFSNQSGLITYVIGNGDAVAGVFDDIDWGSGPYWLETKADPTGGDNYSISGTTQFMSVPYAFYAKSFSGLEDILSRIESLEQALSINESGATTYTLHLDAHPKHAGGVSGSGKYNENEEVIIIATAAEGWEFVGWTGDTHHVNNPDSAQTTVTMPAGNVRLTANFEMTD